MMMIDIDLLLTYGATYKKVATGEVIFREGTQCNFYHQVIEGSVKWVNIDEDGKEFIQNIVDEGECFGEMPLFDGATYAATAIAQEDSVIIRLHKVNFLQLITDHPQIHFAFTKLLAERVRFKFYLLKELAYHNPEKSIAALISYLKKHNKNICPDCNQIKLTRQQIADMTGLRVETVIRAMRHMHERGEITIDKGKAFIGRMIQII